METGAAESGPAVSRVCVATSGAGIPGPLTVIQRSGGFYRLYLKADPVGTELAVASPGIDEVSLIADLIAAIREQVMTIPNRQQPVVAAFHVGMTRLIEGNFVGKGTDRVVALSSHPAVLAACARPRPIPLFAVAVTAGLFHELRAEGLPRHGWELVSAPDAWLIRFAADGSVQSG